ncbi:MAG: adenosylcobinamide-GDP ribazoletransferase [Hyphomicrobium sp.]
MIAREVRLFLVAVQFLTRLPVKQLQDFDAQWLDRAAKYFPLVGALIGALAAMVLVVSTAIFPQPIPILLALLAGAAATGAMHEDGLADAADGLLGGATRERRLEIMKDSRLGVFGALALGFVIAFKFSAIAALGPILATAALVAAHAGGRMAVVLALRALPYAGDVEAAKVRPLATAATNGELALAMLFGVAPGLALLPLDACLLAMAAGLIAAACLGFMSWRRIQGYTGDILGAVEQVFEAVFLVVAAAIISGPG